MENWKGRVALVTGASSGIGFDIAQTLAFHGMKVVACARRLEKLETLAENGKNCRRLKVDSCLEFANSINSYKYLNINKSIVKQILTGIQIQKIHCVPMLLLCTYYDI